MLIALTLKKMSAFKNI